MLALFSANDMALICQACWLSRTSDPAGEFRQPSAYSVRDPFEAISDEGGGLRDRASSGTLALPMNSPAGSLPRLWPFSRTGCVLFRRCHARITTAAKERQRIDQLPLRGRMWPIRPPTAAISGSIMRRVGEKGPKSSLEYGCFFSVTWLMGLEVTNLEACIADLKRTQLNNDAVYQIINAWFTALEYRPFSRAYFIYRAQRTPFVREFSHHLERGLLHYYKGDFFSAVQVLVPAVEGILRLYVCGKPKETGMTLVNKIHQIQRPIPHPEFTSRHSFYKDILERFLRKWFFAQSNDPTLETIPSYLNRHYVSHLPETKAFYQPSDCNRLFAYFDVLLEVITLEYEQLDQFLNLRRDDIPEINELTDYYGSLILPRSIWSQVRDFEEGLMSKNPNYTSVAVPDWTAMLLTLDNWFNAGMDEIRKGGTFPIHATPPGYSRGA